MKMTLDATLGAIRESRVQLPASLPVLFFANDFARVEHDRRLHYPVANVAGCDRSERC